MKHGPNEHTMVVANTPASNPDVPDTANVIYETVEGGRRDEDRITSWTKTQELRSGKYTLWDHHFELPAQALGSRQKHHGQRAGRYSHSQAERGQQFEARTLRFPRGIRPAL